MDMDRSSFLMGAGALGLIAGAAGLAETAPALAEEESEQFWDYDVDVLVAGSGLGGLSAATAAAEEGMNTLMVEVSIRNGGGAILSGGWIHTCFADSWDAYKSRCGEVDDPTLPMTYEETANNEWFPWLEDLGLAVSHDVDTPLGHNPQYQMGSGELGFDNMFASNAEFFESFQKAYDDFGGQTLFKTRVTKLYTDDGGAMVGAQASVWENSPTEEDQTTINIRAKKVILATGNFSGNKGLMCALVGPDALHLNPAAPFQNGDGLLMAVAAGAGLSQYLNRYNGDTVGWVPGPTYTEDVEEFFEYIQSPFDVWEDKLLASRTGARSLAPFNGLDDAKGAYQAKSIWVNYDGKRFVDESAVTGGYELRVQEQRKGIAWSIADKKIHDADSMADQILQDMADMGSPVLQADTIEDLADQLAAQGVRRGAFLNTVKEYNDAVNNGTADMLDVPRSNTGVGALDEPPFYAAPITGTLYVNYGGVLIDEHARALTAGGRPVKNLYTPCPCGGGVFSDRYMGGNALAGVFGYIAGKHAAEAIQAE
jgi:succinate dehydrogenase/fumarate reductase flavoprotein subunit